VGGQPADSTVSRTGRTTMVTTPGTGTSFSITAARATRMFVAAGVPMPFEFNGGQPGTPVTIHAMSQPTLVATAMVDPQGRVSGLITLPASLPAGAHSLVVSGYSAAGQAVSSYLGIDVAKAPTQRRAVVLFDYGSSSLKARARATLDAVVAAAQGRRPATVTVGAVRAVGATSADRSLALTRARNVAAYLRTAGMPGSVQVGTSIPTSLTTAAARRVDVTVTYR
jgi:outer membrane protein OmpA-like peptidoglycan-associated protein